MKLFKIIYFFILTILVTSCGKEETQVGGNPNTPITLSDAEKVFKQISKFNYSKSLSRENTQTSEVDPNWHFGGEYYLNDGKQKIVCVPIKKKSKIYDCLYQKNTLLEVMMYKDSLGVINSRLLCFIPDSANTTRNNFLTTTSMNGVIFTLNDLYSTVYVTKLTNGEITDAYTYTPNWDKSGDRYEFSIFGGSGGGSSTDPILRRLKTIFGGVGCPSAAGGGTIKHFSSRNSGGNSNDFNPYSSTVWITNKGHVYNGYFEDPKKFKNKFPHGPNGGTGSGIISFNSVIDLFSNDFGQIMDLDDDCLSNSKNGSSTFLSTIYKMSEEMPIELGLIETYTAYNALQKLGNDATFSDVAYEVMRHSEWEDSYLLKKVLSSYPSNEFQFAVNPAYSAAVKGFITSAIDNHKNCIKKNSVQPKIGISSSLCGCFNKYDQSKPIKDFGNVVNKLSADFLKDGNEKYRVLIDSLMSDKLVSFTTIQKYISYVKKAGDLSWHDYRVLFESTDIYADTYNDPPASEPIFACSKSELCGATFTLTPCNMSNGYQQTCGVDNLFYSFTPRGGGHVVKGRLGNLFIFVPTLPTSNGLTPENAIAHAINDAFDEFQRLVKNPNEPIPRGINGQEINPNSWVLLLINKNLRLEWNGVVAKDYNYPGAYLLSIGTRPNPDYDYGGTGRLGYGISCGTIFTNTQNLKFRGSNGKDCN